LAAFTNTQMFACLFGDAMILRLSEPNRAALHAEGWKAFEPMPGRPIHEYMAAPARVLSSPLQLQHYGIYPSVGKEHFAE
jgi:hypothetical protein